jgi:hypothetical protein
MVVKKKAAPSAASKKPAPKSPAEPATQPVAVIEEPPPPVELSPGISLAPFLRIAASLAPFITKAEALEAMAGRAVIDSTETYAKGLHFLQIALNDWDQVEALRKAVKGPLDDYGRLIQATFTPVLNRIDAAKKVVNTKMLTHKQAEDKKAADAQQKIRDEQKAEADKLAAAELAKGNAAGAEAIQTAAAMAPVRPVVTPLSNVRVGGMSAGTRKVWKGTVAKPLTALWGIIDGRVPISCISWNEADLNRYAASIKVTGELNGIMVAEVESLATRGR